MTNLNDATVVINAIGTLLSQKTNLIAECTSPTRLVISLANGKLKENAVPTYEILEEGDNVIINRISQGGWAARAGGVIAKMSVADPDMMDKIDHLIKIYTAIPMAGVPLV